MRRLLCVGGALGLSVLMLSCGRRYDSDPHNKERCLTNMLVIWQKLRAISDRGDSPRRLGLLYPYPLTDRTMFRCPSSSDDPTHFEEGAVLKPNQCSYIYHYLGAFTMLYDDLKSRLLVLYEKDDFHGPGRNVVFANGHDIFLPSAEFNEALAFTEKWMKENMEQ